MCESLKLGLQGPKGRKKLKNLRVIFCLWNKVEGAYERSYSDVTVAIELLSGRIFGHEINF